MACTAPIYFLTRCESKNPVPLLFGLGFLDGADIQFFILWVGRVIRPEPSFLIFRETTKVAVFEDDKGWIPDLVGVTEIDDFAPGHTCAEK
jgi:hypothetical protein